MKREDALKFNFGEELAPSPDLDLFRSLLEERERVGKADFKRKPDLARVAQRLADANPGFGQPALIGRRVVVDGDRHGVVDRVDAGVGELIVWFGKLTTFGAMRETEAFHYSRCEME